MPRKDVRRTIAPLGVWYDRLLVVDAAIRGVSEPQQASSLLAAKLQEREQRIRDRVADIARLLGRHPNDVFDEIAATGKVPTLPDVPPPTDTD